MADSVEVSHSKMVVNVYEVIGAVLSISTLLDSKYSQIDQHADYELMLVRARDAIAKYKDFCDLFDLTPVPIPTI